MHRDGFTGAGYGGSRGRIKFIGGAAYAPSDQEQSSGLEDFFAGLPTNGTLLVGDPTRHIHNWGYAGFVQDDFRVTKNVTLNFGLRYEVNTVIKEAHNLLGNFDINKGLIQVGMNGVDGPYNPDRSNFAPRAGFAWDILGNGRTVLRAGAGLMYETVNWESFLALNNSLGLATVPTGANIDSAGATSGGNIATAVAFFPGSSLDWFGTVFPGNNTINCDPVTGGPCTIMLNADVHSVVGGVTQVLHLMFERRKPPGLSGFGEDLLYISVLIGELKMPAGNYDDYASGMVVHAGLFMRTIVDIHDLHGFVLECQSVV